MFCANCGSPVADGARFCPECGSLVAAPATQPVPDQGVPAVPVPTEMSKPAEVSAQPAYNGRKKKIVAIAIVAMILAVLATFFDEIGFATFLIRYYSFDTYFDYLGNNLLNIFMTLSIPAAAGVLFVVLCNLLGRANTLLTAIPMSFTLLVYYIRTSSQVLSGGYSFDFCRLAAFIVSIDTIAFLIFFCMAVAKKDRGKVWRILTLVAGIAVLSSRPASMFNSVRTAVGSLDLSNCFSLLSSCHSYASEILVIIAMTMIAFSAFGSGKKT
ncbi:MAG: zinc-ribbon domain-containing protein [Clostridia bacterium]|nr:zinc-ribbon domain-containing protein [Clostridia bacterium]